MAALAFGAPAKAQNGAALTTVPGPYSAPIFVTSDPNDADRLFVVQRSGTIRLRQGGTTSDFLAVPGVSTSGEGGLLSMAFHPDYGDGGTHDRDLYVFKTVADSGALDLVVEEWKRDSVNPNIADPGSAREVVRIDHPGATNHNGGQLQFGPSDGMLYISTGDGGGTPQFGQDQSVLLGKLLRIDPTDPGTSLEYQTPADNPFVGVAGADEIWSYGLRNPWRFSFDRGTGDLTVGDVGQSTLEEIDFARNTDGRGSGANFGWNCFEGTNPFTACSSTITNHSPPVLVYPNPPSGGASVTGGYIVRDPSLPALAGRYVYADLFEGLIRTAVLQPGAATCFGSIGNAQIPNLASFGEDVAGRVYAASLNGPVYRLDPAPGDPGCAGSLTSSAGQGSGGSATPAGDSKAPGLDIGKAKGSLKQVEVVVEVDEVADVEGAGDVKVKGGSSSAKLRLKGAKKHLAAGQRTRLKLKLTTKARSRARRAVKGGGSATANVTISARDAAGNTKRAKKKVRLRS